MEQISILKDALKEYFGFDTFKGDQERIIQNLMDEKDTFVLMPTGGGKSLCYQLPALLMDGVAIVISPLIALMKNQVDAIKYTRKTDFVAHFINSSLTKAAVDEVKEHIINGVTKLLYVAPESLTKKENIDFLKTIKVSFYAVDEAHCISEWGHDFRPEYRRIRYIINDIGRRPIIALTATATDKVRIDIKKTLGILDAQEFRSSFNRPNLWYEVRQKDKNVDKEIVKYIKSNPHKSGIIYCLSRKSVEGLAQVLCANDIKAAAYHAGLESDVRSATQEDFLMERIDVIVATIAFGMGIDKPDVRFVIHYDIPKSLEGYYQETGRAGRDGGEGRCIAFYTHNDLQKLEKFMESKPISEQDIGRQLLKETANYCESHVCRRKLLLHYFGEDYPEDNCNNCDNCIHPHNKIEAKSELVMALKTIQSVKENFKSEYIIALLRGDATDSVIARKHDQLEFFGEGADKEMRFWNAVLNQAMLAGYIKKDIENYGLLKITSAGKAFMKKPKSFKIVEDSEFEDVVVEECGVSSALDETLFKMLVQLRKDISNKMGVPPYVIFQDPSLDAMTTFYPQTMEEMQGIQGVGSGKAKRYGQPFIDLIKKYCEDNSIERPSDIRVRTVADKSQLRKINIIQSIDRQVDLEDIALAQGIDFEELLDDLEAIVYSGTKINIDYFIEDFMDEDHEDEIYDYFMDSDTDNLDTALDNISSDITEEEVRLIRIKFLSEMAN